MFIDHITITVQAGSGGNGCESIYRRTDRKSVPNGGDGGNGGSVIFRADPDAQGLEFFRYKPHLIAESGKHGGSDKKRGRNGEDLIVKVPVGTRIYDKQRNFLIRDLTHAGEEVVVVPGQRGGLGNLGGKKASQGERGQTLELELKVRLPAEVFLIGLPNSGKSKLLNRLTGTRLKDEEYPFSTKSPQVGVWRLNTEDEGLTLCELPSLYEGSREGRGAGADFLKHLESAKLIVYMLDPVSQFAPSIKAGLELLKIEVEAAGEEFAQIPSVLVVNKMDLPEAQAAVKKQKWKSKEKTFFLSALTGEGIEAFTDYLAAFSSQLIRP